VEVEVRLYAHTTCALEGDGWSAPCPRRFTPRKKTGYPPHKGLGGPRGRSGFCPKNIGLRIRTVQLVASRYTELHRPPILLGFRENARMVPLALTAITVYLGVCRSHQSYRLYGIARSTRLQTAAYPVSDKESENKILEN
jgi:hypothetical protein